MNGYLRCPAPHCTHHTTGANRETAAETMTDHLIRAHGLPEVSASYQADLLLPITTNPQAA
ncbi:hypothetical protein ACFFSH_39880, partial [Streptomyces filamentosus]|uniref:DUF1059 domain-containing protein n=1 Tax=Streptomyces filamentosus TaxID=67294 RepID=A0A919BY29_STRFL|nr:hypothetical protein [Streptomyces filamentosus]GHG30909.1 hypothetical protein GCM10017667_80540 [Streptomyces filamentosus]GHG31975.1 hypothetical protein GCM10017667_82380 [Streptomyces filamentosus]